MLETFLQDVRYAVRLLRRSPLFTATAALSLAIGIGANTTIFSIASALLLRPLPGLAESDRLWMWGARRTVTDSTRCRIRITGTFANGPRHWPDSTRTASSHSL